ncbi:MAG: hypothetical protein DLM70_10960 [Chloroflexi bacterium]|nr:MAG: hypothetical protein DLM70_10960 [Chloroflexota bacterium]
MKRSIVLLLLVLPLALSLPQSAPGVDAASPKPLKKIAVRASDLGGGLRLIRHGKFASHVQGQISGSRWIFRGKSRTTGIVKLENWVATYNSTQNAAEAVLIASERGCGSKGNIFGYHELTPGIGDHADGCYFPSTFRNHPNTPAVVMTLRRGLYVTLIRAYASPSSNPVTLENTVVHLATVVDRRIELAHSGSQQTTVSRKPSVQIIACRKPCLFYARGRGTTLYTTNFGRAPRRRKFAPPGTFTVSFQFDCAHIVRDRETFLLTQLQDTNDRLILREEPDQRNRDTVTSGLASGARLIMLNVQVQNNSCVWWVKAAASQNFQP